MEHSHKAGDSSPHFSAILLPHRSLTPKGFTIMMSIMVLICLTIGMWFYLIGAWPVLGFMGLDVLILYLTFKANYRDGRIFETVELTDDHLSITHHPLRGKQLNWQFNPYWVKLNLRERRGQCCLVEASSHGKKLVFAHFLSDDEKREFTSNLNRALTSLRIH